MTIDLKTSGKYEKSKIKEACKLYNLIIYSTEGIFDTSKYNIVSVASSNGIDSKVLGKGSQTDGFITLGYNPTIKNGKVSTPIQGDITPYGAKGEKVLVIPVATITNIIVKSKRNFLLNQSLVSSN